MKPKIMKKLLPRTEDMLHTCLSMRAVSHGAKHACAPPAAAASFYSLQIESQGT